MKNRSTIKTITGRPNLLEIMWQLLLPIKCLGCGSEGEWICDYCLQGVVETPANVCVICGKFAQNGLCELCRQTTKIDGIVSLFPYKDPLIQELIKQVKYRGHHQAFEFLANTYSSKFIDRLEPGDWVATAIPLSSKKLGERGFNQAEVLATQFGQQLVYLPLLIKKRETAAQAKLSKDERRKNVHGCFAVTQKEVPEEVIIFDDVVTTGSTLKEAAMVLRKAGCKKIWAITVAHG